MDVLSLHTISAMQALLKSTLTDGQTVAVSDLLRGGLFRWISAATNAQDDGTIFEAAEGGTGRWVRVYSGPVDVRWFGAVGDGTTLDTAAFVKAIALGRPVYAPSYGATPSTTYLVEADQIVIQTQGQSLFGDGMGRTIIRCSSEIGAVITMIGAGGLGYNPGMGLKDLTIDWVTPRQASARAVSIVVAIRWYLERVEVLNSQIGIDLKDALIGTMTEVHAHRNVIGEKLQDVGTEKLDACTLIQHYSCRYFANTSKAVDYVSVGMPGGHGLSWHACQFEENGDVGNSVPIVNLIDLGRTGVGPAASFKDCWFEKNVGSDDLKFRGANESTSLHLDANLFFSTLVADNLDVDNCQVEGQGNGINPTVSGFNINFQGGVGNVGGVLRAYFASSNPGVGTPVLQ